MYPKFTIKEIRDNRQRLELLGQLSSTHCGQQQWVDNRWLGYLQHEEHLFYGRWHREDDLWRFVFEQSHDEVELQPGSELIVYDGYWGERVELVLQRDIDWQEAKFKARGEWDHAYCAICWATISEEENREHRLGNGKDAVCLSCFEDYIRREKIDFITCV